MRYNYYNRYSNNNRTEADISRLKTPNMYIPAKRNTQTGRSGYDNNPDQNNQRMQNDINMRTPQNEREMNQPEDHGPEPFVTDIERETIQNNNFIVALWTGEKLQITLMSLLPRGDIGLEIHPETDQFLRIEEGYGIVEMGDDRDNLDFQRRVADGDIVVIPAGKWHNLTNIGQGPLKLYSVYAPPEHPAGTVYRSRAEEELQRFNQQNQNQTRQPQNQAQPPQEQPPMTPVRPQAPMTPQVPMTPQPPMTPQEQPRMTPQCPHDAPAAHDTAGTATDDPSVPHDAAGADKTRGAGSISAAGVPPRLSADAVARTGSASGANNPARPVPANDAAVSDYTAGADTAGSDDTPVAENTATVPAVTANKSIQAA
ncbi:MAG: cupin domain-containing protein [Eubacteriales bacterium]